MAKRSLPATEQEVEALAKKYFASLSAESDRGCVLVGAAFIDEGLEILLRAKMLHDAPSVKVCVDPLFTGLGPLRSFWAKTQLCRAFELINDWMYQDLERIRNLRNLFAHSYENASFEDPRVIALTEGLEAANEVVKRIKEPSETRPEADVQKQEPRHQREFQKKERVRFTMSASYLAGRIHGQADAYRATRASK